MPLYSGTGVQGQVTWNATPQSASVHQAYAPPSPPPPPPPPPPAPATGQFAVRKVLDDPAVQGDRDMSGFVFDIVAEGTGAIPPILLGTFTTDATGRTPAIDAIPGTYRISETARPPWADVTIDPGPITVTLVPATVGAAIEFSYTNRVPVATIDTAASDLADGDHVVELDGSTDSTFTVVDRVSYCGLVPGTTYSLVGALGADGAVVDGTTTFVPGASCGTESVRFPVRGDSGLRGRVAVITETLVLAASGRVVAQHDDPHDVDQTINFVPTTIVNTPPTHGDTGHDHDDTDDDDTDDHSTTPAATSTTTVFQPPPGGTLPRTGGGPGAGRITDIGSWLFLLGAGLFACGRAPRNSRGA